MTRLRARVLIRRLHLWLGMSLGALFALLGVTGSALVFYVEIDAALNPVADAAAVPSPPDWDSPVWDEVLATARKHFPDPRGQWSFEVTGEGGPIPARYYPHSEHHGHHTEREMVWFSADGTRVLRVDTWGQYLMSWIYELHMHLLAGETGRLVVGWAGFAMLLLLATGIAVWWPRGSWRKALACKRNAVPLRRLRDLHKLAGLWSVLLLFLLVITGALLALPEVKSELFARSIGVSDTVPEPRSGQSSGRQIPVLQALAIAHRALPDATLAFIDVPGEGAEPFRMRVRVPGDPHQRFPARYVFVDQYSGRVLAVHDVRRGNATTLAATWIRPLHDGSISGLGTRVLAVLVGLFPAALFATGLLHWLRRRAVRLHRKQSSHLRNRE